MNILEYEAPFDTSATNLVGELDAPPNSLMESLQIQR
jgi:hypothetical protein